MPGSPVYSSEQIAAEKRKRAREWREFRARWLYSQSDLGQAINCSTRTVSAVEAAACIPLPRIQRAFRELKQRHEREDAA